jgi:MFS family permease
MHSTPDPLPSGSGRTSSIRWLIAAMVGGFAFVSYLQRMNISVAAELMMPDLGLTKIEMGQVFSSFLVGYAIFQVPAGRLGDAIGPKTTLTIAALLWGGLTFCTGLVPKTVGPVVAGAFLWLVALRLLLGACEAATFPVGSRAIRNWTPPKRTRPGECIHDGREFFGGCNHIAPGLLADVEGWVAGRFLLHVAIRFWNCGDLVFVGDESSRGTQTRECR